MIVRQLIARLSEHDPDAEVRVSVDRSATRGIYTPRVSRGPKTGCVYIEPGTPETSAEGLTPLPSPPESEPASEPRDSEIAPAEPGQEAV